MQDPESVDFFDYVHSLDVINNWRSSHSFPLNTFQTNLRRRGFRIDDASLVAQRIKRLASIELKMRRFSGLRLSQIQDIGGCRVVMQNIDYVREMVDSWARSDVRHELAKTDDYLTHPQRSGYRGVHMIYRYFSDRNSVYNGLRIELQIRSQLQHAWATAVETVGTFLKQSLKSSMGEERWLRFFALMGTAIAFQEGTPHVDGTPSDEAELLAELSGIVDELDVIGRLEVYGNALQLFETSEANGEYFIITLDAANQQVTVRGFPRQSLAEAQRKYIETEQSTRDKGIDTVLVSVNSMAAIQKAYPNYFLDTRVFIGLVRDALNREPLAAEEQRDLPPSVLPPPIDRPGTTWERFLETYEARLPKEPGQGP